MNLIGQTINQKYHIIEMLGEGGTSVVYKARKNPGSRFVAVKFMKEKVTTKYVEDLVRFRKESEIISRLSHPNIIRVFDTGEYGDRPYIVTELLEGESLDSIIIDGKARRLSVVLELMKQLAGVLSYVHGKGIIHRDIKPGNIFVIEDNNTQVIKLLDFGVSNVLELGALKDEDFIVGTFSYMSPEATGFLNRRIDERSDLYSVGVVFYTLLAGNPPFTEKDVNKLLHQQIALQPPDLGSKNEEIPNAVKKIVMKLLAKDPDDRYQSAYGLLYDIQRFLQGERDYTPGERDQRIRIDYNTKLVGREIELQKIKDLFEKAEEGSGHVLLVRGEAGSGKSRLVEEFSRFVYEKDGVFLRARCIDHQNKTPYLIFKDLLDDYIRYLQKLNPEEYTGEIERLKNIVGDFTEIIISLNPRMEKYLDKSEKLAPLEPERANQRLLTIMSELFLQLPYHDKTVVCFIDDLHWVDEGSLSLLREILRKIEYKGLFIIGTYRDNEVNKEHGLNTLKEEAKAKEYAFSELKLPCFNRSVLNKFISGLLGEKEENAKDLTNYIFKKTSGNPFFSINLIREFVEKGAINWDKGSWDTDWKKLRTLAVSNNMVETILRRVEGLDSEQVELLCIASVIGREFNIQLLYRLTKMKQAKVIELLERCISLQFIDRSQERGKFIFAHDRIRDVFYQKLTDEERQDIHLEIAKAIEADDSGNPENDVFELAHHYVEAKEEEKMLEYVIPAANRAKITYANEEAVKYYKIAMGLLEKKEGKGSEKWIKCSENLIDIYLTTGKNDEAIALSQTILPLILIPVDKARIFRKLGIAYFKKGDWKECENHLSKGLGLLGEKLPIGKTGIVFSLVRELFSHVVHSVFPFAAGIGKKGVRMEDREVIQSYLIINWMYILSDLKKLACNILRMLNLSEIRLKNTAELGISISGFAAACMTLPSFKRAQKYHLKALRLRKELGNEWGVGQSLQFLGFTYSWKGMHKESIHNFELSRVKFSKIGDLWELGMVLNGLGYAYRYTSDYKKCIDFQGRYLDISEEIKNLYGTISGHIELAFGYVEAGEFYKAEPHLQKAIEASRENNIQYLYCCSLICKGYLELEQDRFEEAVELLEEAKSIHEKNAFLKDYTVNLYNYLAEAYIGKYRTAESTNSLTKKESKMILNHCSLALKYTKAWANHYGGALRCLAKYYALTGRYKKAEAFLGKSLLYTQKINRKYETAKAYFEFGILYENMGRHEESKKKYQEAYNIFKAIEAKEYVKKCGTILSGDKTDAESEKSTTSRLKIERKLSTILTASRYLSSILELDELLERIMDCALEHVGAERGALLLYPEEGKKDLELVVARNVSKEELWGENCFWSKGIISKVESEKKAVIISDALSDDNLKINSSVVINKIRSVLCAPVLSKGKMLGLIYLDNSLVKGLFNEDDLSVLDLIASQAGVSVENARLYNRLRLYSNEIERSRDEIAQWNETLEQKVIKRTEELEHLNKEYKDLTVELKEKNIELNLLVEQLKAYAQTAEELAVTKERNRFAMDVHDTMGHSMILLINLLEVCKIHMNNSPEKAAASLEEAISLAREGIRDLRRSIYGLVPEKLEANKFITALERLIGDFKSSGVHIDFSVNGIYDYRNPLYTYTLFKACQEAMTNAVRHGEAKNIVIRLTFSGGWIKLLIRDDGIGCADMKKGFGLSGMEQRIKDLKGDISYKSSEGEGFTIEILLPLDL
ncbi:MAG: AAA family ATPase [Clostridia bacterium]|nr:AAA family ATPase [Clostridia bacterium]